MQQLDECSILLHLLSLTGDKTASFIMTTFLFGSCFLTRRGHLVTVFMMRCVLPYAVSNAGLESIAQTSCGVLYDE
ncbi:hypothetical protein Y032_0049g1877 [Ancylostoma ceylanicum]|uniref:Uncharacterized protein n=1 Tax=Ancylostoma ceylanicum TaxID=53326 RepID=A0A016U9X9_9BILA|nr:hypothetical protein Y032_0049g1877 [Ancylostoma ceylanicum]